MALGRLQIKVVDNALSIQMGNYSKIHFEAELCKSTRSYSTRRVKLKLYSATRKSPNEESPNEDSPNKVSPNEKSFNEECRN